MSSRHFPNGTATYAMYDLVSSFKILPSWISTLNGSPKSRQGKSTVTGLPGKSQQTASDSKAHWPNHFCCRSMVMRYWVGRLLKGAKETM